MAKGWDVRALQREPLFRVATMEGGGVLHVGWCPTRSGLRPTTVEGEATLFFWKCWPTLPKRQMFP